MSRRLLVTLLVAALLGTMAGVSLARDPSRLQLARPAADPTPSAPSEAPVAEPEPARPAETPEPSNPTPAPAEPTPAPTDPTPEPAAQPHASDDVAAVQRTLAEHRYYVGVIDGAEGPATRSAVMAFQKVHGLAVDGVVGPQTLAALAAPTTPALRGGPATRIEVDLTKQVAYLVEGGSLARIMPVSSGSGERYRTAGGGTARSLTPVGTFTVQRKIAGVRNAPLGTLYDPLYFHEGWALHGSNSVPAYPASHGCVRLTRWDAAWLFGRIPVGTTVMLYGGTHTFTAGSAAAGTNTPAGDPVAPAPSPTATVAPKPPAPSPTAAPKPPAPSPTPTVAPKPPAPSPTPTPPAEEHSVPEPLAGEAGQPRP